MPMTPVVSRPMGRASVSGKRMAMALRETRSTSSRPLVIVTPISSSSSRRLIAMSTERGESYSTSAVRLTMPCRVANSR